MKRYGFPNFAKQVLIQSYLQKVPLHSALNSLLKKQNVQVLKQKFLNVLVLCRFLVMKVSYPAEQIEREI